MGTTDQKKTDAVAWQYQQQNVNSSSSSSNATTTTTSSTPVRAATVANGALAASMEKKMDEDEAKSSSMIAAADEALFDMDAWEARFPFAAKTSDPRAKELDTAHELFLQGIQLAKNTNNLSLASEYIASAYVRDEMAVVVTNGEDEAISEMKALDVDTLDCMLKNVSMIGESEYTPPVSLGILFLIVALSCGQEEENQPNIVVAMKCLNDMLEIMTDDDMIQKTTVGQLGGLTRAKVYYWRGRLYKEMRNGTSAMQDWTKAIELDPSLVDARLERLVFWKNSPDMKISHTEIYAECITFLDLVHEDYMDMDVIYALLASTIYLDARLGTFDEAMEYYRKSLQATSRRLEVYGLEEEPGDIICSVRNSMKMAYADPERHACKLRKELDAFWRIAQQQQQQQQQNANTQQKTIRGHSCQKQQHPENDEVEIQLGKCGRCTLGYCSRECVRDANWKEHKCFAMKFLDTLKVRQRTDPVMMISF